MEGMMTLQMTMTTMMNELDVHNVLTIIALHFTSAFVWCTFPSTNERTDLSTIMMKL